MAVGFKVVDNGSGPSILHCKLAVSAGGALGHQPLVAVLLDCAVLGCVVVSSCVGIHESVRTSGKQWLSIGLADLQHQPVQLCMAAEHHAQHAIPVQGNAVLVPKSCKLWRRVPARSCWPLPGGLFAVHCTCSPCCWPALCCRFGWRHLCRHHCPGFVWPAPRRSHCPVGHKSLQQGSQSACTVDSLTLSADQSSSTRIDAGPKTPAQRRWNKLSCSLG